MASITMTSTKRCIIVKFSKAKYQRNLESRKKGAALLIQDNLNKEKIISIRKIADFPSETMEARRQWYDIYY